MFRKLLVAAVVSGVAAPAMATPVNLVTNGNFETTTNGAGEIVPGQTTGTDITSATGWSAAATGSNAGYPFLFVAAANTATTTGFPDAWDKGNRTLWGAANGGANSWDGTSIDGGNFLIADGDYHATAITQTIAGLVVGHSYVVAFDWAAGQWSGNTGATTEKFQVSLGGSSQTTATYNLASKGFSGWMHQTFTFTYDGANSLLSFLAEGTPVGEPPMLLLDGVSMYDMTSMPEPAAFSLLAAGIGGLVMARRRRTRA